MIAAAEARWSQARGSGFDPGLCCRLIGRCYCLLRRPRLTGNRGVIIGQRLRTRQPDAAPPDHQY